MVVGDSGTMLLDLVGVKRRFIELLEKTHPNVVPQFTSWLDMKVSEYKVNGYMVTDCEITAVPTWINNVFKSALLDPSTAQQLRQTGIEAAMYSYAASNPHGPTPGSRTNPSASPSPSLPLYRQLNGEDGTPPLKRKRPSSSPRTSGVRDSAMTSPSPGLLPPMGMTPDSAVSAAAQHTAAQYLKNLLQRRADPSTPASDAVSPRPVQHSSPIKPRADNTPSKPEAETVESRDAIDGALNLTVSSNAGELKSEPLDLSEHPEAEGDVSGERPRHRRRKPEGPMKIQAQASGDEMDHSVTSPSDAQAAQQSPVAPPLSAGFDQPFAFDASQQSPSQTFPYLLNSLSRGETITGSHLAPGSQVTAGGLAMASPAGGEVKYSMAAAAFMSRDKPPGEEGTSKEKRATVNKPSPMKSQESSVEIKSTDNVEKQTKSTVEDKTTSDADATTPASTPVSDVPSTNAQSSTSVTWSQTKPKQSVTVESRGKAAAPTWPSFSPPLVPPTTSRRVKASRCRERETSPVEQERKRSRSCDPPPPRGSSDRLRRASSPSCTRPPTYVPPSYHETAFRSVLPSRGAGLFPPLMPPARLPIHPLVHHPLFSMSPFPMNPLVPLLSPLNLPPARASLGHPFAARLRPGPPADVTDGPQPQQPADESQQQQQQTQQQQQPPQQQQQQPQQQIGQHLPQQFQVMQPHYAQVRGPPYVGPPPPPFSSAGAPPPPPAPFSMPTRPPFATPVSMPQGQQQYHFAPAPGMPPPPGVYQQYAPPPHGYGPPPGVYQQMYQGQPPHFAPPGQVPAPVGIQIPLQPPQPPVQHVPTTEHHEPEIDIKEESIEAPSPMPNPEEEEGELSAGTSTTAEAPRYQSRSSRFRKAIYQPKVITHSDGTKKYVCPVCQSRYSSTSAYTRHQYKHDAQFNQAYRCSKCQMGFYRRDILSGHMKTCKARVQAAPSQGSSETPTAPTGPPACNVSERNGRRYYSCPFCNRSFSSPTRCNQHMNARNCSSSIYCKECMRQFPSQEALDEHKDSCTGVPPPEKTKARRGKRKREVKEEPVEPSMEPVTMALPMHMGAGPPGPLTSELMEYGMPLHQSLAPTPESMWQAPPVGVYTTEPLPQQQAVQVRLPPIEVALAGDNRYPAEQVQHVDLGNGDLVDGGVGHDDYDSDIDVDDISDDISVCSEGSVADENGNKESPAKSNGNGKKKDEGEDGRPVRLDVAQSLLSLRNNIAKEPVVVDGEEDEDGDKLVLAFDPPQLDQENGD